MLLQADLLLASKRALVGFSAAIALLLSPVYPSPLVRNACHHSLRFCGGFYSLSITDTISRGVARKGPVHSINRVQLRPQISPCTTPTCA